MSATREVLGMEWPGRAIAQEGAAANLATYVCVISLDQETEAEILGNTARGRVFPAVAPLLFALDTRLDVLLV